MDPRLCVATFPKLYEELGQSVPEHVPATPAARKALNDTTIGLAKGVLLAMIGQLGFSAESLHSISNLAMIARIPFHSH